MAERLTLDEVITEIDEMARPTDESAIAFIGKQARLTVYGMFLEYGQQIGLLSPGDTAKAREHLLELRDRQVA